MIPQRKKSTQSVCDGCPGMCCRYVALPIETPEDAATYEEVRWYLMHEGVTVFVTDGQWYLSVATTCRHLDESGLCGRYAARPKICRDYSAENCDYHGGEYEYELFFSHPEQIERYAREQLGEGYPPAD